MMHTAKYMHQIISLSNDAYEEIFQEIDTKGLVEKRGIIYVWTNKNLKSRNLEIKVRKELGVEQKLLTQKQVLELEPNLKPVFDAGVIYESAMHARDPHGILKKIFKLQLDHLTYCRFSKSRQISLSFYLSQIKSMGGINFGCFVFYGSSYLRIIFGIFLRNQFTELFTVLF